MPTSRPLIRVHDAAQATAAVTAAAEAGRPLDLLSAAGAPAFQGRRWFRDVVAEAARSHPAATITAIVDCADAPGHALACLEDGAEGVAVSGLAATATARLAAIAEDLGVRLLVDAAPDLDLLDIPDPLTACRALFRR